MALYTKCILKEKDASDGLRVSIMSRHTLQDGTTPHPQISPDSFDIHMPALAPSPKLIGDYYKRGLSWEDFEKRFTVEMSSAASVEKLQEITEKALRENVTLLCIEETCDFCHRRLVAELCKKLNSDLVVEHR